MTQNANRPDPAVLVVVVQIGGRRYAVDAAAVERAVRMAALAPLPDAPPGLAGVLDLHGDLLAVVDPRPRLAIDPVAAHPDQHLVVVRSQTRFVIWVDAVEQVVTAGAGDVESLAAGTPASAAASALVRLPDEVAPLLTLDALDPGHLLAARGLGATA